jgi:uncharacterized protein YggE
VDAQAADRQPVQIKVTGRAETLGIPDRITYQINVVAGGASEQEALAAFSARKERLHARLSALGVTDDEHKVLTDQLRKNRPPKPTSGQAARSWVAWSCSYVLMLEFSNDRDEVADRVVDGFFDSHPGVDGIIPWRGLGYSFTTDHEAFNEACRLAAIDGSRQARAIAAERGMSLGHLVWMHEPPTIVAQRRPAPDEDSPVQIARAEVLMMFELLPTAT